MHLLKDRYELLLWMTFVLCWKGRTLSILKRSCCSSRNSSCADLGIKSKQKGKLILQCICDFFNCVHTEKMFNREISHKCRDTFVVELHLG